MLNTCIDDAVEEYVEEYRFNSIEDIDDTPVSEIIEQIAPLEVFTYKPMAITLDERKHLIEHVSESFLELYEKLYCSPEQSFTTTEIKQVQDEVIAPAINKFVDLKGNYWLEQIGTITLSAEELGEMFDD